MEKRVEAIIGDIKLKIIEMVVESASKVGILGEKDGVEEFVEGLVRKALRENIEELPKDELEVVQRALDDDFEPLFSEACEEAIEKLQGVSTSVAHDRVWHVAKGKELGEALEAREADAKQFASIPGRFPSGLYSAAWLQSEMAGTDSVEAACDALDADRVRFGGGVNVLGFSRLWEVLGGYLGLYCGGKESDESVARGIVERVCLSLEKVCAGGAFDVLMEEEEFMGETHSARFVRKFVGQSGGEVFESVLVDPATAVFGVNARREVLESVVSQVLVLEGLCCREMNEPARKLLHGSRAVRCLATILDYEAALKSVLEALEFLETQDLKILSGRGTESNRSFVAYYFDSVALQSFASNSPSSLLPPSLSTTSFHPLHGAIAPDQLSPLLILSLTHLKHRLQQLANSTEIRPAGKKRSKPDTLTLPFTHKPFPLSLPPTLSHFLHSLALQAHPDDAPALKDAAAQQSIEPLVPILSASNKLRIQKAMTEQVEQTESTTESQLETNEPLFVIDKGN